LQLKAQFNVLLYNKPSHSLPLLHLTGQHSKTFLNGNEKRRDVDATLLVSYNFLNDSLQVTFYYLLLKSLKRALLLNLQ
jgi:hypothetical protein